MQKWRILFTRRRCTLYRLPIHNLQCAISDFSFQKKMERGNFVNANDNHQLSYSDFMGEWKSQPSILGKA